MKKVLAMLAGLAAIIGSVTLKADDGKPIQINQLPSAAQQFIKQHFAQVNVSFAKQENEMFGKTYKVIFVNGCKVEFDKNGNWKEVDCIHSAVPQEIIPAQIANYIKTNHSGLKVIEIDRDSKEYEVKLENGLKLEFDTRFNLIDIDD